MIQNYTDTNSSDPYCIVVHQPPEKVGAGRLSETLIGVSSTRIKTLSPEWDDAAAPNDPTSPRGLAQQDARRGRDRPSGHRLCRHQG